LTEAAQDPRARACVVTVGGGRGGIGKSTVSAQLAWAAAQLGRRVLLVDADLAAPSQHLTFGAGNPQGGLSVLMGRDSRAPVSVETPHPNLRLVAGGGRNQLRPEGVNPAVRLRLAERLRALDADLVVVDVGAGLGYNAADLLELGDHRVIVATTQAASVHEAFALLKALVTRTVRRHLARARQLGLLEPAVRTPEGERVSDVLRRVHAVDPELAAQVTASLDRAGAFLFGNQLQDGAQLGVLQAAVKTALDYLSVPLTLLGWLRTGAHLPELATLDDPLDRRDDDSRLFRHLAGELVEAPPAATDLLLEDLHAAVPDRRTTPPPLPVEALVRAGSAEPAEPPAPPPPPPRKKALVYVRPPRRRRSRTQGQGETQENQKPRKRTVPLPGMPPHRVVKGD
jgi:flagellar biosynthesis protein FlhG